MSKVSIYVRQVNAVLFCLNLLTFLELTQTCAFQTLQVCLRFFFLAMSLSQKH